jgi:hypothetical protein
MAKGFFPKGLVVAATSRPTAGEGPGMCGGFVEAKVLGYFSGNYLLEPVDETVREALEGEDMVRAECDVLGIGEEWAR